MLQERLGAVARRAPSCSRGVGELDSMHWQELLKVVPAGLDRLPQQLRTMPEIGIQR